MDGAASNYSAEMIRIGLAGDVMLGRLVDRHVLANSAASPGYVWGNTLSGWRQVGLAMRDRPGTNYVCCDRRGLLEPYRTRVAGALTRARAIAHLVIVSAHVGSNWGPPTPQTQALAHDLIDLGADLYWGHSNHTVQGIERYRDKPILYACGDFVDDYAVDATQRNDLSCLFEVMIEDVRATRIHIHPVRIAGLQVNLATGEDLRWMHRWLRDKMAEFDTKLSFDGDVGVINIPR